MRHVGRYGGRNHVCNIWWLSVKGCEFGQRGNFALSRWLEVLPLQHYYVTTWGSIPKRPIAKTAPTKTAQKNLISKNIVQNGPFRCPKWPIIQPKRPIAKSKTAHSYIQNGPLSLSAFGNVQSDLEILYMFRPVIHGLERPWWFWNSQMFGHALWCNLLQVQVCERKYCM